MPVNNPKWTWLDSVGVAIGVGLLLLALLMASYRR
jgi:hypothetical protein